MSDIPYEEKVRIAQSTKYKTMADLEITAQERTRLYLARNKKIRDYCETITTALPTPREIAKNTGICEPTCQDYVNYHSIDMVCYSLKGLDLSINDISLIKGLSNMGIPDDVIAEKFDITPIKVEGIRLNRRGRGVTPAYIHIPITAPLKQPTQAFTLCTEGIEDKDDEYVRAYDLPMLVALKEGGMQSKEIAEKFGITNSKVDIEYAVFRHKKHLLIGYEEVI